MNLDGLRTALYTALNVSGLTSQLSTAYSPLAAIFYEIAPQVDDSGSPSAFPFVVYDITSDTGYNDKGATGTNAIVQIDVYSCTGYCTGRRWRSPGISRLNAKASKQAPIQTAKRGVACCDSVSLRRLRPHGIGKAT